MITFLFSAEPPKHSFQAFKNEWVEVEVKQPIHYTSSIEFLKKHLKLPESLKHDINRGEGCIILYLINILM